MEIRPEIVSLEVGKDVFHYEGGAFGRLQWGKARAIVPCAEQRNRRREHCVEVSFFRITKHDLADQIEDAIASGKLPSQITESLDAVRNIGNFAAHTQKSKASGQLLDVEAGEAEWNLETVEALFDFYFVQPKIIADKKTALNPKLAAAGKPAIK